MRFFPYWYFSSRLYYKFFCYSVYRKQDVGNYGFGYLYSNPHEQKLPDWMFNRYDEVLALSRSINMTDIKKKLVKAK